MPKKNQSPFLLHRISSSKSPFLCKPSFLYPNRFHPDLFYSYNCLLLSRFFLINFHTAVYKKCILKNGSNNIFVRITWCAILTTSAIFPSLNKQVILLSRKYIFISQKYYTVDFSDMVLTDIKFIFQITFFTESLNH